MVTSQKLNLIFNQKYSTVTIFFHKALVVTEYFVQNGKYYTLYHSYTP